MTQIPDDDTRSMRERMLAGDLYLADEPEIAAWSAAAFELMETYNAPPAALGDVRRRLLAQLLGRVGEDTVIRSRPNVQLLTPTHRSWPSRVARSGRRPSRYPSATTSGSVAG